MIFIILYYKEHIYHFDIYLLRLFRYFPLWIFFSIFSLQVFFYFDVFLFDVFLSTFSFSTFSFSTFSTKIVEEYTLRVCFKEMMRKNPAPMQEEFMQLVNAVEKVEAENRLLRSIIDDFKVQLNTLDSTCVKKNIANK